MRSASPRRTSGRTGTAFAAVSAGVAAAPSAYLAIVSLAGLLPARSERRERGSAPVTRFAILVPAHDEAAGIGATLDSFHSLDYPRELFSVHVVADNCTDGTAEVVRRSGWNAHERSAPAAPGKGPALNWLNDRLAAGREPFDAVVVVDADTTLDPGFLLAMDAQVRHGVQVAQGYYSVRDPDLSPAAGFRFAALACRHHLRPLGRCRLGGSAGLYGNGMVFAREVSREHPWSGHLVEDAELQNELLLAGHRVTYVPDAVLRAEMPHSLSDATSQNQRWERGRIELARRYVPRLLAALATDPTLRVARADAVCDHLVPPLSVLATVQLGVTAVHAAGAAAGHRPSRWALGIDLAALAALAGHTFAGLASVGAPPERYTALLSAPRQVAWKVGLWAKSLRPGEDVAWTRTRRNVEARG